MDRYIRSFSFPDELIELPTVRSAIITKGGLTVSYDIQQPGWRWSTHVRPLVGTEWCGVHHVGVLTKGRMRFLLVDGEEATCPSPVESTMSVNTSVARIRSDLFAGFEARTRDLLARFRGRVVKMTGDGGLATFDGAARALRCAVALRTAAADLDLTIRGAVHTGEVEVAGDDIRGVAIHEASRMLAFAAPDEILVSAATAGLSADSGVGFEDRGEHELRGLPGRRRLFALR